MLTDKRGTNVVEKLQTSETLTVLEARAQTIQLAAAIAVAMATYDVQPGARFERPWDTRFKRGLADPRPHDGWVVDDDHKYLSGYRPGKAFEAADISSREVLLLGADGRLRTVYESPREEHHDPSRRRVFHDAWLEGWQLREPHRRPMPVVAMREHDAEATRGDYFLTYSRTGDWASLSNRHEDVPHVTSEQFVQDMLKKLTERYELPEELITARAS